MPEIYYVYRGIGLQSQSFRFSRRVPAVIVHAIGHHQQRRSWVARITNLADRQVNRIYQRRRAAGLHRINRRD
jgi:hypothetical protein